jgi:dTDP-4-dehydrorhamnose 3,5-epimerase
VRRCFELSIAHIASSGLKAFETPLSGVLLLEPKLFGDSRGYFLESYSQRVMAELGITVSFVQDNHSFSFRNVVRGLHYQVRHTQGKLVRVLGGEILDVAVDLRQSSPSFGRWHGVRLSGENHRMLWIPPGLAHGFCVLSDIAQVLYKATDFYCPDAERTIAWNDPELNIRWELVEPPVISARDSAGVSFRNAEKLE